jgi:hypothetical protein
MGDLTFSSYLQGPLGEAIEATDTFGTLPAPAFSPSVTMIGPADQTGPVKGPDMRMLGPGDVAGLVAGSIIRREPPAGSVDIEPNYLAAVEVTPPELPWVLTPARATSGRLRPWLVLIVLDAASAQVKEGKPLPFVASEVAQLPDLRDSWGWAHVQRSVGDRQLAGGATATTAALARLICPRRLSRDVTYLACLVPAFNSGVAAGLGQTPTGQHDLAWSVDAGGMVTLPVYDHWTFTTGPDGDFEDLVTRLRPANRKALLASSTRPVDVRAPWTGDKALSDEAQPIGVSGALRPFGDPPIPNPEATPEVLATLDVRLRAQLNAPAERLLAGPAGDTPGTLAPPLYGARHVLQDHVESALAWIGQLNASVPNRIAAGLGATYVRAHQEELMGKAWEQVGAIREANRLRATVELTAAVAERVHDRHVARLTPGELIALAAPAQRRAKTSDTTTLSLELRMSRLPNGVATSAFARWVRPAGKLARRAGVSVTGIVPRGLSGEVSVPAGEPVVPVTPAVDPAGVGAVISGAVAGQLMVMTAMSAVAAVNQVAGGYDLGNRFQQLDPSVLQLAAAGNLTELSTSIVQDIQSVTAVTASVLEDMTERNAFGPVTQYGVPIAATGIASRLVASLHPGDSHWKRLASQTMLPARFATAALADPVMAYPTFPIPTALALLDSDPEWFMPGLGKLPSNRVALLRQNSEFIESYLVGINHEMMRELLWREYPTDQRGTPFTTFWPRADGSPDVRPLNTWIDAAALGDRLLQDEALAVLLVRGDVVRRYPGMLVTAVRSGPPDAHGHHRPDPNQPPELPQFVIRVDQQTAAYAFRIAESELMTAASAAAPGWFFVFAENSFRLRFGFDNAKTPPLNLDGWDNAVWPPPEGGQHPAFVPVVRGHAIAGVPFGPADGDPRWNRDAADIARITLQRPFRVAIQADVLLHPEGEL